MEAVLVLVHLEVACCLAVQVLEHQSASGSFMADLVVREAIDRGGYMWWARLVGEDPPGEHLLLVSCV